MTDDVREVSNEVLIERLAATIPRVADGIEAQREQRRIIRELQRRKVPQEDIGEILGVSQQAVSKRMRRPIEGDTTP